MADLDIYKFRLARLVKKKRQELGMSLRDFAEFAQIPSHTVVDAIEKQDYQEEFRLRTLNALAENVFNVSPGELLNYLYGRTDIDSLQELFLSAEAEEDLIRAKIKNLKSLDSCLRVLLDLVRQMIYLRQH